MSGRRRWLSHPYVLVAVFLLGSAIAVGWLQHQSSNQLFTVDGFRQFVMQFGVWGPVVYVVALAIAVVVSQVPQLPMALAAGAIWGPLPAGIYSVMGGFAGGAIAYWIGRTLGRSVVKQVTGKTIYFSKQRGERYLGWFILISRLLPLVSFDLISYGAGVTGLSFPIYATATLVGMIPSTFLLTYAGSAIAMSPRLLIAFTLIFLMVLVTLPWGIRRYNWFNLRDIVRIE